MQINWCLDNNIQELIWDEDLKCDEDKALQFIEKDLMGIPNLLKIRKISFKNVFKNTTAKNKDKAETACKNLKIKFVGN